MKSYGRLETLAMRQNEGTVSVEKYSNQIEQMGHGMKHQTSEVLITSNAT